VADKTISRARAGVLAGAAVTALLAFPGIASAAVTSEVANGALTVKSDAGDAITITAVNGQVKVNDVDPGTGAVNADTITSITVNGDGGANAINLAGVTPTTYPAITGLNVTINGGGGNDTITGSEHADLLNGDDGDDQITPNDNPAPPNVVVRDDARGGNGNDIITWNGGDDDDLNEGGPGIDTVQVNGAAANETFTVKPGPNGRIIFDRAAPTPTPPGLFNIDAGTVEKLDLNMNAGDDTLVTDGGTPGFALDVDGGDGNDNIDGGDAADLLAGGNGNDRIVPDDNPENTLDTARGDAGDDTMVWNGGDDNDVNDGGDGNDTSEVNGAALPETFTVKPSTTPGRVQFDRVSQNPAPFSIDIGTTERLLLNADGGDDKIFTRDGLAGLIAGEFNGGEGNDLVEGTDSPDRLNGDAGHDVINSRDKAEDLLDCGTGFDLAKVDKRDFLRNCNIIIGHRLKVRVDAKKLAVVNGRAVMPLECAGTKKCKGVVKVRSGGKTLAGGKFNIKKRSKTVRLKLTDKGRRLSALGKSVTVHIDAKDTKGNGWRTTQKLKLTR
jgi:Ca2+-binding RTX toxin-like protein